MTRGRSRLLFPRGLLVDLDETLIDAGSPEVAWQQACSEYAPSCGVDAAAFYTAVMGARAWYWKDAERAEQGRRDLRATATLLVEMALRELGAASMAHARAIADLSHNRRWELLAVVPKAIETLTQLHRKGVRMALLTNDTSQLQRAKIERFDLERHFEIVLIEGERGFGKPDPRIYREAINSLGVPPTDTWMVGDNLEWDVAAPQREGIRGIWIDVAGQGVPSHETIVPDLIIATFSEIIEPEPRG